VITQHPLPVHDEDGSLLGDFYADLVVEDELIIEIKAARHLVDEHTEGNSDTFAPQVGPTPC
jgi:hypothetical protein